MAVRISVSRFPMLTTAALVALLACPALAGGAELQTIQLPKPRTEGGKPLMQALAARHSSREFATRALPQEVLSDLLWAAFGVNRPDKGGRTAPSAMNWQEIEVYVVTAEGAWLYDATAHALKPVAEGDLRAATGVQPFVKDAPLNLVLVADTTKMTRASADQRPFYAGADAAFIAQNVYLYCASEGLATVVRASFDRAEVARALKLGPGRMPALAQTVGYPKE